MLLLHSLSNTIQSTQTHEVTASLAAAAQATGGLHASSVLSVAYTFALALAFRSITRMHKALALHTCNHGCSIAFR